MPEDLLGLARFVGKPTFARGAEYAETGAVTRFFRLENPTAVVGSVRGNSPRPYDVTVSIERDSGGRITSLAGSCSCPMAIDCKHIVAVVQAAYASGSEPPADILAEEPDWRDSLFPIIKDEDPLLEVTEYPLALQFEMSVLKIPGNRWTAPPVTTVRVGIRPVRMGAKGRWIRSGISWSNLHHLPGYGRERPKPAQAQALNALSAITTSSQGYYSYNDTWIFLGDVAGSTFWELVDRARATGVAMVNADKAQSPVHFISEKADAVLDVTRTPEGLSLVAQLTVGSEFIDGRRWMLLGEPAHSLMLWEGDEEVPAQRQLSFAVLDNSPREELRELLTREPLQIPAADEKQFLTEFYPVLRRRVRLVSQDESFQFPEERPPALGLVVEYQANHQISLSWQWTYHVGGRPKVIDLRPQSPDRRIRDVRAEGQILDALDLNDPAFDAVTIGTDEGPVLIASRVLGSMKAVNFLTDDLPQLEALGAFEIVYRGTRVAYRPAKNAPVVEISGEASTMDRDWFDLMVVVTVDGEQVPFTMIFKALALDREHIILPSGLYFSLARGDFDRLRRLIDEARQIEDRPEGAISVHRLQTSLFDELMRLGVFDEQAEAWRESLRGLFPDDGITAQPTPAGLKAQLRPYQQTGFDWLSFLYDRGIGGVLADDMGLGKTVQTLAMICRARSENPDAPPFLVVAPTSVVGNWKSEAAKFAPGLKVVTVTQNKGTVLTDAILGADVVITSYALFRLGFDGYQLLPWSGLILDEAQFVKNHQSKAYQCVKKLDVRFKLAITGTPMENNLLELWALFSIVAPGLFTAPGRFTEYYQKPIEREGNRELLAQLRRRITPLMMRRTKEQVAPELPAKQEQVLELELNPKHQKVYQTHLQRERQKILGLITDLNKNRLAIFRSLTLLRQISLDASLVDEKYAGIPSTKLDALMELLADVVAEGHRTLIFSQFTGFLGKVRQRLDEEGIEYCYLDGTTRNRPQVLAEFKEGTAPVFLISLKAGGFGLNLTEADYCILLDPWWNPATEAQAIDRTHRIGQTKQVMVYRLVAKGTIEEKVMALKASKAKLFHSVMADEGAVSSALTAADIRGLLD
ncbi:helicase [Nakamurella silvestris]|nr:helicase [Nakamurella silvestris]